MMIEESNNQDGWRDPDEAPELTEEWFEKAHQYHGDILIKRGRGPLPILGLLGGDK